MAAPDPATQPAPADSGIHPSHGAAPAASPKYDFLSGDRPETPPPQCDPQCSRCLNPKTTPYRFDPIATHPTYGEGDILRIRESVHAPIDTLFFEIDDTLNSPQTLSPKKDPRPGVVVEYRPIKLPQERTMVYLMATYSKTYTFARLPSVLRHFCLPVSPHCEIKTNIAHVHTSPEWPTAHGWLIAMPFVSYGKVLGRWGWKGQTDTYLSGFSLRVDKKGLQQLLDIHRQKQVDWWAQCAKDEKFLHARYEEYQEFKRQGLKLSQKLNEKSDRPASHTEDGPDRNPSEHPSATMSLAGFEDAEDGITSDHHIFHPEVGDTNHPPGTPRIALGTPSVTQENARQTVQEPKSQGKGQHMKVISSADVVGTAPVTAGQPSSRRGSYAQAVAGPAQGNLEEQPHQPVSVSGGTPAGKTKRRRFNIFNTGSQRKRN